METMNSVSLLIERDNALDDQKKSKNYVKKKKINLSYLLCWKINFEKIGNFSSQTDKFHSD